MNLPQLPADKANHFAYGAVIGTAIFCVAFNITKSPTLSAHAALLGTAIIGGLKEGLDAFINWKTTGNIMQGPHVVELADAAITGAGALPIWASVMVQTI